MALQEQKQDDYALKKYNELVEETLKEYEERIAKLERDNLLLMDNGMFAITSLLILSFFGEKMFGPFVLYMYVFNGFTLSGISDKLFKKMGYIFTICLVLACLNEYVKTKKDPSSDI